MVTRHTDTFGNVVSCSRGATIVECAFSLPFFIIAIFIAIELAYLTFVQLALQYSLNQTARIESMFPSSRDLLEGEFSRYSRAFGVGFPLDEPNYFDIYQTKDYHCLARHEHCSEELPQPVSANEAMIVRVRHPAKLLFLPITLELTATVTKKNEPYDPSEGS